MLVAEHDNPACGSTFHAGLFLDIDFSVAFIYRTRPSAIPCSFRSPNWPIIRLSWKVRAKTSGSRRLKQDRILKTFSWFGREGKSR